MLARRALVLLSLCVLPASAQVTINVDAALNRHAIDPRVYGVAFADGATLADLQIPINRWGGNTTSRYNWGNSTANHARDFYFENIPDTAPNGGSNGESADLFIQPTLSNGSQPIMTIPVLGYLPKDRTYAACGYSVAKYGAFGCCADTDAATGHPDCGNGFHNVTGQPLKNINDPLDVSTLYTSSHQGNWIQHNVSTFGSASTTGVKYYAIDNEPGLWDSTHFDIHPNATTYDEIWGKTQDYGAVIKSNDPSSLILGFEEWGWLGYFDSTADWNASPPVTADRAAHGNVPLAEWLLQQAHAYEQMHGTRLIDVLTVHWYPQGKKNTTLEEYDPNHPNQEVTTDTKTLRNQSTRSLWDPAYVEQSWIQDVPAPGEAQSIVRLIPRMREWVNKFYPGTKIGVTEYDWGDGNDGAGVGAQVDPNGATAQADVLGIFGREGLDMAARWTSPPAGTNVYNAFKIYRNYDGLHSKFGDISVSASAANPDVVASFAALRSSDRALTVMVINKDLANTYSVTVNLANYNRSGNVQVWQLGAANTITNVATITTTPIVFNAPPETVNLLVVPGSYLDAPAGVVARATGTTVNVQWNTVANAATYQVYRATTLAGGYAPVGGATAGTSFSDGGLQADKAYLYRVVANSASASSGYSAPDVATTTTFADDPLNAGTVTNAAHVTQLRTAVDALRTAAGLGAGTYTDAALGGVTIKATHVLELRTALDQARAILGLPQLAYTDPGVPPDAVVVKAAHITELRNGVK